MLEVEERVLDEYQLAQRLNQKSPKYFNKNHHRKWEDYFSLK